MKSFLFTAFMLFSTLCYSFEITNVIEQPGSKEDLYKRAILWITKTFNSANDVIQLQDKEDGKIITKGNINYSAKSFNPGSNYSGVFNFTLTIECKENKYRYKIDQVSHDSPYPGFDIGSFDNPTKNKKSVIEVGKRDMQLIAESLESAMSKPIDKEDW